MDGSSPSNQMAAILTVLHDFAEEDLLTVPEAQIAERVQLPAAVVRHHLVGMARLGLVSRHGSRRHPRWALAPSVL